MPRQVMLIVYWVGLLILGSFLLECLFGKG